MTTTPSSIAAPFTWPGRARCAVSFSFDDGCHSQISAGLPLFAEHGMKATFFVLMSAVREDEDGWRRAVAAGHELGNHTVTHPCSGNFPWSRGNALEDYDLARIEREMASASDQVEAFCGRRPVSYAYCCGHSFVGRGLDRRSYVPVVSRHFLVGRGYRNENPNDPAYLDLPHVAGQAFDDTSVEDMRGWLEYAAGHGHWIAFAGHDIGERRQLSVGRRELDAFLRHLRARGDVWIDTVGAVAAHIAAARSSPAAHAMASRRGSN